MPQFRQIPWMLGALIAVSGCSAVYQPRILAPFADQPETGYVFGHQITEVTGTVWLFGSDGRWFFADVDPGFEVNDDGTVSIGFVPAKGLIYNKEVRVVAIEAKVFDLETKEDFDAAPAEIVAALVAATDRYCRETGFVRTGDGAAIQVRANQTLMIEFCAPPEDG